MSRRRWSAPRIVAGLFLALVVGVIGLYHGHAIAQQAEAPAPADWVTDIEKIFIRSEDCKQCHERHYEEWKGVREQTPDLKTFGRVDAALLHGTSLESPVFRTVLGVWLQTNPTTDERRRCLSCHAPSTTVFPQYADKIVAQVLSGKPQVEGIGCASCHLIKQVEQTPNSPPSFKIEPGKMIYGPYADPEENLVHPAMQSALFRGANYCASCHFDKVKDVTQKDLAGEILQGTICQDCHMEPSTGSSTSKRVVVPGTLIKNRNLQAEWMPRVDLDTTTSASAVEGTALVRIGSLPHSFPDGDPVLKQFYLVLTAKDAQGMVLKEETKQFGLPYDKILRGPIPDPFIKGGYTRKVPFSLAIPAGSTAVSIEAVLNYALIPTPDPALKEKYLATLATDKERESAKKIFDEYTQPRLLTYRAKTL